MSRSLSHYSIGHFVFGLMILQAPVCLPALAQTSPAQPAAQPSAAQRQTMADHHKKMAELHSQMAACLQSNKPVAQCHQELRGNFRALGGDRCPFFDGKGMTGRGRGMMGHQECFDWMMTPGVENNQ